MSSSTDVFTRHTAETAPASAQARVKSAEEGFGFLPTPVSLMAESPELLEGFLTLNGIFNKCSLESVEREVVIMTVATRVRCHYCVAMHSAMLTKNGTDPDLIEDLREQRPLSDDRLEVLRTFTLDVMDTHGNVSDESMRRFLDAGFTRRAALDVVLGLGAYTLSTTANRMTEAPLDPPFEGFEWHEHS